MKVRQDYTVHIIFLIALFTVGNAVITAPFHKADNHTFLGFLIAGALFFIALVPLINLIEYIFKKSQSGIFKYITIIGLILLLVFCIGEAISSFTQYIRFAKSIILPETNVFFMAIVFIGVCAFLCAHHSSVTLKFALFSFVLVLLSVVAFFIMSAKEYRMANIILYKLPSANKIASQTLPYIKRVFLPALIILFYQDKELGRIGKKQSIIGYFFGFCVLALCLLNSVLLFGGRFSSSFDFPYASAISTVTVGHLFSRMDGFSYFIYFACVLLKISVLAQVIKNIFVRIKGLFD